MPGETNIFLVSFEELSMGPTLLPLYLILLGFSCIVLGLLLILLSSLGKERGQEEVRGGGVIIIGPIPIVFGSDASTVKWLLVLAILLTVLLLVTYIVVSGGLYEGP